MTEQIRFASIEAKMQRRREAEYTQGFARGQEDKASGKRSWEYITGSLAFTNFGQGYQDGLR